MRGKGGFLTAPRAEREPGRIVQYSTVNYWQYIVRRAAVLPEDKGSALAVTVASHQGMSGHGGNTQIHMLVAVAGHTAHSADWNWNAGS
jgi:hypothetical protein